MAFSKWFKTEPSAVELLQADLISDLKAEVSALNQTLREQAASHRKEIAEWRDLFATVQFRSQDTSNLPSLLDEMQEPDEEAPLAVARDLYTEFARIHGEDNFDLVKQEPANG